MALININIPESYSEQDKVIIEQRTKIEVRTWVLRASLALNVGFVSAFIGLVLNKLF